MVEKTEKIGFIGLGKMGSGMAACLVKNGYPVTVYDIVEKKVKGLVQEGAQPADSPMGTAVNTDVVISMILDDSVLEEVSMGPRGIFKNARPGTIYIDMSTVSPIASERIGREAEKKGIKYLRSSVFGTMPQAASGKLIILVSGPRDAYEQCADIFNVMGQKVTYFGPGEEAKYLKLLHNIMVAIIAGMTAEALIFGKRAGVEWNQMIDVITNGVVTSPLITFRDKMLRERNFAPFFSVDQMVKDLNIILRTGETNKVPLPMTSLIRQLLLSMQAKGKGDQDFFVVLDLIEEMAALQSDHQ
jgi:3-hydroxyisobutyrate dehydrogenase-like beta-hydroxyacid dehydrogenase